MGILAVLILLSRFQREGMDSFSDFKVRFVAIVSTTYLQMSQLEVMYKGENIAKGKRVGTRNEIMPGMAELAVDGTSSERAFPDIYQSATEQAGWVVDLGAEYPIEEIIYYNRSDGCADRATKMHMFLFNGNMDPVGPTDFTFTDEAVQTFQFAQDTTQESGSAQSACTTKKTKQTCLGSMDQDGDYCSWSDASTSCNSPESVNQAPASNSMNCNTKTTKNSCTSTLINAEDKLYCSWSDAQNKCSYTSAGTGGGPTYSASAGVNLPTNVNTTCAACTGAGNYWNKTINQCTITDTPGYSRTCN